MTRPADGTELRGQTQIVDPERTREQAEWMREQAARDSTAWIGDDEWLPRQETGVYVLVTVALSAVLWAGILLAWAALP